MIGYDKKDIHEYSTVSNDDPETTTVREAVVTVPFKCPYCGDVEEIEDLIHPHTIAGIAINLSCGEELSFQEDELDTIIYECG